MNEVSAIAIELRFTSSKLGKNLVLVNKSKMHNNFVFCRKIAKKNDVNKDGYLTKEELRKWVQENHMKYLLKNAMAYIADVDLNNDSQMSFKEYEDSHFPAGKKIAIECLFFC